jgi:oligopeptide transport system substrate-binding protein
MPARSLIPVLDGYKPPESLLVEVQGNSYDVLDYNPTGARELLAKAGYPAGLDSNGRRLKVDLLGPNFADVRLHCEMLQQQWRANLGVQVNIATQEFKTWIQNIFAGNYRGITEYSDWGFYLDPNWFLDQFVTGSSVNASGWSDPQYDDLLAKANATLDPLLRMQRLADCERHLLRAMPVFPEFYDVWAYPQKPYVRGIRPNVMDVHPLKYAWIDTKWRPS